VGIGGLEWMGVVHGEIIVDTLLLVLDHSSLPLRIHMGGMGSFPVNVGWNVKWNKDKLYNSCRNPSLGFTTKARVCKVVGQEGSRESHNILLKV